MLPGILATALLASPTHAAPDSARCVADFGPVLGDAAFASHPVSARVTRSMATPPDVRHGKAHRYRTALREQARQGANFAGHFTLATIGCGASTICLAVIDARTGRVSFPPELASVTALVTYETPDEVQPITFRRNSRMLIVVGTVNEREDRYGLHRFLWTGRRFRLTAFVPSSRLCKAAG